MTGIARLPPCLIPFQPLKVTFTAIYEAMLLITQSLSMMRCHNQWCSKEQPGPCALIESGSPVRKLTNHDWPWVSFFFLVPLNTQIWHSLRLSLLRAGFWLNSPVFRGGGRGWIMTCKARAPGLCNSLGKATFYIPPLIINSKSYQANIAEYIKFIMVKLHSKWYRLYSTNFMRNIIYVWSML